MSPGFWALVEIQISSKMNELKFYLEWWDLWFPGYSNAVNIGVQDINHDLEYFPWAYKTNSVVEITLIHAPKYLRKDAEIYFGIFKKLIEL